MSWFGKVILLATLPCLMAATGGCLGPENSPDVPGRADVPIDRLLAPPSFAADHWPEEGWQIDGTYTPTLGPTETRRRTWGTTSDAGLLQQEIMKFDGRAAAGRSFRFYDPRSLDEDFPLRVDASDRFRSASADETRVYCLGLRGSLESCSVWTYWARYGRYVLRLDHLADLQPRAYDTAVLGPGIDLDTFLVYVRAFDQYLTELTIATL